MASLSDIVPALKFFIICLLLSVVACKPKPALSTLSNEAGKQKIKIKGSESELNLIHFFSDEFTKNNTGVIIKTAGGGSGIGISALLENNVDIAISSRPMNEEELSLAESRGLVPLPVIIAMDAVAIITNPKTGVDSLSLDKLRMIFDGTIRNWKEVGGADVPVKVYRRGNHSGTFRYITDRLSIKNYADETISLNENSEMISVIKKEIGAIGYVGLGSLMDENGKPNPDIWAISTFYEGGKAHSPYEMEAVKTGEYPLIRPLYQYVIGLPKGNLLDFLKFELSEIQQTNIEKHGYFPITPIYKQFNLKNVPELNENSASL